MNAATGTIASVAEAGNVPVAAAAISLRVLVPDLPGAAELLPWLHRIDERRWYTNEGPLVGEFEAQLASLVGAGRQPPICVTTSSGTTALELALAALELPHATRVLVPALTFPATANAVLRAGHLPVLSDVCADTWTLTPAIARELADRHRCGAVVPVAAFGTALPVADWDAFVRDTGVPVLIDAAAALGTVPAGERVCVAYSLHATKPLGIGEGGVIATHDSALAARVRRAANHGFESGRVAQAGTNARMSEFAAAVGLAQLARWPGVRQRRLALWDRYRSRLAGSDGIALQPLASRLPPAVLVVHAACDAARVAASLQRAGIETRRWYHPPLHEHPAFAALPRASLEEGTSLPTVDRLAGHLLGLPFHSHLADCDVDCVVDTLRHALEPAPPQVTRPAPRRGRVASADPPPSTGPAR